MTRRERLENKVAKRGEWAGKRRASASAVFASTEKYRGDHAFNFQPGHIPERARVIRAEDRAHEDVRVAAHHESKAAGLAAQLDRTVFSDDANAVEALRARITENEAKRVRMTTVNKLYRKGDSAGLDALGLDLESLKEEIESIGYSWVKVPYESWQLTNLGARIRSDKERIAEIERRATRTAGAEANGGVLVEGEAWVRVTFAEKPERKILDALRAAEFRWSSGHWIGERVKLPAIVNEETPRQA